jgi:hypothetical protein
MLVYFMIWNCLITNVFDETKVRDKSRGFYHMMMWAKGGGGQPLKTIAGAIWEWAFNPAPQWPHASGDTCSQRVACLLFAYNFVRKIELLFEQIEPIRQKTRKQRSKQCQCQLDAIHPVPA